MISDTIRILRIEHNMSQEELATKVGVSLIAIRNYEHNIWKPGLQILQRLADVFHVRTEEITRGYSLVYDEAVQQMMIVRNMGGNMIRVIEKLHCSKPIKTE